MKCSHHRNHSQTRVGHTMWYESGTHAPHQDLSGDCTGMTEGHQDHGPPEGRDHSRTSAGPDQTAWLRRSCQL